MSREQHVLLKQIARILIHGAVLISLLAYHPADFAAGGAVDDEAVTLADTPVTIDVLANDVGSLDAVIANYSGPDAALLNNSAIFSLHPTTPTFGSNDPDSDEVALGDLDGDRDLDAIIANVVDDFDGDDEFSEVWLNDGRGNFLPHPATPRFGQGIRGEIALGDIDSDNDLDLVAVSEGGKPLIVMENIGGGILTPLTQTTSVTATDANALALGDVNGDTHLDAVIANAGTPQQVFLNNGSGHFTPHPTAPTFGGNGIAVDVALGDINGDGAVDAVVANFFVNVKAAFLNDGNGHFTPHPTTPTFGGLGSWRVALVDINGDQKLDVVTGNGTDAGGTGAQEVFLNDGGGNFTPHPTTPTFGGDDSYGLALGDLDGNGTPDAVTANSTGTNMLYLSDEQGNFAPHPTQPAFTAKGLSAAVALGDLDGIIPASVGPNKLPVVKGRPAPGAVIIVSDPANGGAAIDPTTGAITYTPHPGFAGVDTFRYSNGLGQAQVTVTVEADASLIRVFLPLLIK